MAKKHKTTGLTNEQLASIRTTAVEIAAKLPEAEPYAGVTGYTRPGKTAEKVVTDAQRIVSFIIGK